MGFSTFFFPQHLGVTKTATVFDDLNALNGTIWCRFDTNSANSPTANDGIVFQVLLYDVGVQLLFDRQSKKFYFRIKWVTWGNWQQITSTAMSSN